MTCQKTGYKATVIEHTKAEFTTQCEDISVVRSKTAGRDAP